jgi:hypothetical protein
MLMIVTYLGVPVRSSLLGTVVSPLQVLKRFAADWGLMSILVWLLGSYLQFSSGTLRSRSILLWHPARKIPLLIHGFIFDKVPDQDRLSLCQFERFLAIILIPHFWCLVCLISFQDNNLFTWSLSRILVKFVGQIGLSLHCDF